MYLDPNNLTDGDKVSLPDGREYQFDASNKTFKKINSAGSLPSNVITLDASSAAQATKIWVGTKTEFDAIPTKLDDVIYYVKA